DIINDFFSFFVSIMFTDNIGFYIFKSAPKNIEYPFKVARITNVHGIRNSSYRRPRIKLTRIKVVRNNMISIGSRNKLIDWKPHFLCQQASEQVAKIATRNREH